MKITEDDTRINYSTNIDQRKIIFQYIYDKIKFILQEKEDFDDDIPNKYKEKLDQLKDFLKYDIYKFLIKEVFVEEFKEKYQNFVFDWDKYL